MPDWRGDTFNGSLKFDHITRIGPENGSANDVITAPETDRDLAEATDGLIWFL